MKYSLPASWATLTNRLFVRKPTGHSALAVATVHATVNATVDYRDRISVVTWLLTFGLGLSLLFTMPVITLTLHVLGSPISLSLTPRLVAAIFLATLAAAGTESVIRIHPRLAAIRRRSIRRTWPYWALPMAIAIISTFLLPFTPSRPVRVLAILITAILLAATFFGLYATIERNRSGFRRARIALDALAYSAALLLFLFVYQTRTRSLLSGTLIALIAILIAVELLRSTVDQPRTIFTYGAIVGIILGQVTWALNYWWTLNDLSGGLVLLLIFYLLVGIAQHGLQGHLTRKILIEFGIFTLLALILIAVVGPGFG